MMRRKVSIMVGHPETLNKITRARVAPLKLTRTLRVIRFGRVVSETLLTRQINWAYLKDTSSTHSRENPQHNPRWMADYRNGCGKRTKYQPGGRLTLKSHIQPYFPNIIKKPAKKRASKANRLKANYLRFSVSASPVYSMVSAIAESKSAAASITPLIQRIFTERTSAIPGNVPWRLPRVSVPAASL